MAEWIPKIFPTVTKILYSSPQEVLKTLWGELSCESLVEVNIAN